MNNFNKWSVTISIIIMIVVVYLCSAIGYSIEYTTGDSIATYEYFMQLVTTTPFVFLSDIFVSGSKSNTGAKVGLFISVCSILLYYANINQKKQRKGVEHGSASFAKPSSTKKIIDKQKELNKIFSQNIWMSLNGKKTRRNNNVFVVGGSGAGKTRFFLKPNILQGNSSYVITDPKGEILSSVGLFLYKIAGYKVKVLNLVEMNKSGHYNPFEYIREGHDEDVMTLINTLITNTNSSKGGSTDPFWDNSEKMLLQAIMFYILEVGDDEEKSMSMVLKLVSLIDVRDDDPEYQNPLDIMFEDFEEEYGSNHIAVKQFKVFKLAPARTALSIAITAGARLAPFNIDMVANLTDTDDLELRKIGEEKTALFVIMSPANTTFNFIASMMFTQLFEVLDFQANRVHGGSLPIHVEFLLDEFANIGKIPNFEKILAYARSLNIGIVPIFQSIAQLKEMYEKSWETIVDNCDTHLYLGMRGNSSTEYVMKSLGKETITGTTINKSSSRGFFMSNSIHNNLIGRELMTQDEIAMMPVDECIVSIKSLRPFKDKKFNLEKHKNYKYTLDFDSKNVFEYKGDRKQKEKLLEYIIENGAYEVDNDENQNQNQNQSYTDDEIFDGLLEEFNGFMEDE